MKMKIALKNVKPNPFRHIDRYPIQKEKIKALKKSIGDTEFWENIVARKSGNGTIEIAYGHHRLNALRALFPETTEFDFIIKDLDDTSMCKIMVHENMDEWGSDASVEQESIRAIVEGYADGRIELGKIAPRTSPSQTRNAPHFSQMTAFSKNAVKTHPYTTTQLMEFTGWNDNKVRNALASLELIEKGDMEEEDYKGLKTQQQTVLNVQTNKIRKTAERRAEIAEKEGDSMAAEAIRAKGEVTAKQVTKKLKKGFIDGSISTQSAGDKARDVVAESETSVEDQFPDINKVAAKLAVQLGKLLDTDKGHGAKLKLIIQHKRHLDDNVKASLIANLSDLADSAHELAKQLK